MSQRKTVQVQIDVGLYPKTTMFIRKSLGKANNEENPDLKYELDLAGGIYPMVTSLKTGKIAVIGMESIVNAAVLAGIDKEEE